MFSFSPTTGSGKSWSIRGKTLLRRALLSAAAFALLLPGPVLGFSLGPYSGQVLDGSTGEPIRGASVLFYWGKSVPTLMGSRSELIDSKLLYTDAQGRYEIARTFANLGLTGSLDSTRVLIYQPGYRAYIVTLYSHESRRPASFKDSGNSPSLAA